MDYREPVQAACKELASQLPGMEAVFEDEIDLRVADPALQIDFQRHCHRNVRDNPPAPSLKEPKVTFYEEDNPSYFPWLSPFSEYVSANRSVLEDEAVVSFVSGTDNEGTNKTYVRERRYHLDDIGIDRANQIIILLPNRIPESVTQILAGYFLVKMGWMVADERWFSPSLSFNRNLRVGYGIPDIVAWRSDFTARLEELGWISGGGAIHELGLLEFADLNGTRRYASNALNRTLTAEVKYSDTTLGVAVKQLYERGGNPGYLKSNCFDEGYGVVALRRGRHRKGAGTITFDEDGFYYQEDPMDVDWQGDSIEGKTRAKDAQKERLISTLDGFAAQTLLCNLSLDELAEYVDFESDAHPNQFLKQIRELSLDQIISACKASL